MEKARLELWLRLLSSVYAVIGGSVLLGLGAWAIRFPNLFDFGGDAVQFARRAEAGLLGIGIGIVVLGIGGLVISALSRQGRTVQVTGYLFSGGVFLLFAFGMALGWAVYIRRDKQFELREYRNSWGKASSEDTKLICAIESAYTCRGFDAGSCAPRRTLAGFSATGCPNCNTPARDITEPGKGNFNESETPTPIEPIAPIAPSTPSATTEPSSTSEPSIPTTAPPTPADDTDETTPADDTNETTPADDTNETTPADDANETTPADDANETTPADDTNETTPAGDTDETTPAGDTDETTPANVTGTKGCFAAIVEQLAITFLPAAVISTLGVIAVIAQFIIPCIVPTTDVSHELHA